MLSKKIIILSGLTLLGACQSGAPDLTSVPTDMRESGFSFEEENKELTTIEEAVNKERDDKLERFGKQ